MKRILLKSLTLLVILVFVFLVAAQVMSLVVKESQASGTRHAISGAIQTEVIKTNSKVAVLLQEFLGTNETTELSTNQYDALIDILVTEQKQLDVPKPWTPGMILIDPWGNRFRIIIQRTVTNWPPIITVTNHNR